MRRQCLRATGTLGHPWPADVHCRQCAKVPSRRPARRLIRAKTVSSGYRDTWPSRHLAIHGGALTSNVLFESWPADGAFGTIVSSDDSLQWRVSPKPLFSKRYLPA
ncbi:hypothetical protein [Desulfosporosinus sp. I2]|uniref:hypothetical protein n=1 Tax=Desulfosporosinus sp. I2 TaxID=1617025 RepID=UPI0012E00FF8|nr:hypothetical protein [Desulfosporosinus sp. I2]